MLFQNHAVNFTSKQKQRSQYLNNVRGWNKCTQFKPISFDEKTQLRGEYSLNINGFYITEMGHDGLCEVTERYQSPD